MSTPARDAGLPLGVSVHRDGAVATVILHRPAHRNAVDGPTARALYDACCQAERDPSVSAIVLYGAGGTFCAGADLTALSRVGSAGINVDPETSSSNPLQPVQPLHADEDPFSICVQAHLSDVGPMGLSRLQVTKPVIAAVAGHAVAGGLELACWADMRIVEENATFGVFCRRFGVPLIDGGTVRLPRLIGLSRAMDMILTGRPVDAQEALSFGLANRVVPVGTARAAAEALAHQLCAFPQQCLRSDRWSALHQHGKPERLALEHETTHAFDIVRTESVAGATRFAKGAGRHGQFQSGTGAQAPLQAVPAAVSADSRLPAVSSAAAIAKPRCVIFDLGGVVVTSPVREILQYERELSLPPHSLNLLLGRSPLFHALERGEMSLQEFAPRLEQEAVARGIKGFNAQTLFGLMGSVQVRPRMLAAIAELRQQGILVGALTNNWLVYPHSTRGVMMDSPTSAASSSSSSSPAAGTLDSVFDFIVESALVGMRKPEPRIFELAVTRAQEALAKRDGSSAAPLQPSEVVFCDDLGKNLKAGRAAGMRTIKVTSAYGRALKELAEITTIALDAQDAGMYAAEDKPLAQTGEADEVALATDGAVPAAGMLRANL